MFDVFDKIKSHNGKRFVYGTGDGADKLLNHLEKIGVSIDGICVSDDFYRKRSFRGMEIKPISALVQEYPNALFMMAFGVKETEQIFKLSKEINLIYPEMPVCNDIPFSKEMVLRDKQKIEKVYSILADDKSKKVFENIINFRLTGDITFLKECESGIQEGYEIVLKNPKEEIVFDCGAYRGDTADDFFKYSSSVKDFYAAEPCPKSFIKLKEKYGSYNLFNCAVGKEACKKNFIFSRGRGSAFSENQTLSAGKVTEVSVNTVDELLGGNPCTIIKYDVEGAEKDALIGSVNTIRNHKPNLLVAAYHKAEDLYEIPLLISELHNGYKIYMKHHPCLPSWETNVYAVFENQ